jgi:ligand-binding sensor domain-containing protein
MKVISFSMGIKAIWYKGALENFFKVLAPFIPVSFFYSIIPYTLIPLFLLVINSFAQIQSEVFLKGAAITDIAEEEDYLWVATYGQGIYRYSFSDGKWINFSTKSGNLGDDIFYAVEVSKNFVWAASVEGLYTLTKKTGRWDKRKFARGGEFGNWIRSLRYDDKENVLWVGRFRNITRFDLKTRKYEDIDRTQGTDQKSNTIKTIELDGDSLIWFGTESGVHIYNKKKQHTDPAAWRYFSNKSRAFKEEGKTVSVAGILFEGRNIWFGTDEFITVEQPDFNPGGVYIYDRGINWDRIYKRNGLGGNGIYSMCRIGNYIWVGVYEFDKQKKLEYGKGLYLVNRITRRVTQVDLNELDITSSSILSFHFDGSSLWIGTGGGLVKLKIDNKLAWWTQK